MKGPSLPPLSSGERAPGHGEASGLRVRPAQWASEVDALLRPRRSSEDRLACPSEAQAQRVHGWSFGPSMGPCWEHPSVGGRYLFIVSRQEPG